MKKKFMSFATGALAMLLAGSMTVTALAASGAIKIEVSPISVLVTGEVCSSICRSRTRPL